MTFENDDMTEGEWLSDTYSTITTPAAARLMREVGGLNGLSTTDADTICSVRGVDQSFIDDVGNWDKNGDPIGEIKTNICPICGDMFSDKEVYKFQAALQLDAKDPCIRLRPGNTTVHKTDETRMEIYKH